MAPCGSTEKGCECVQFNSGERGKSTETQNVEYCFSDL